MEIWKINLIFKGMIFRFYSNFEGCTVHKFQVFEFGDFLGEMCKNRSDSLSKQLRTLRNIIEAAKLLRLVGQLPDWHVFHLSPHEFCTDITSCHKRLNNNACIAYAYSWSFDELVHVEFLSTSSATPWAKNVAHLGFASKPNFIPSPNAAKSILLHRETAGGEISI